VNLSFTPGQDEITVEIKMILPSSSNAINTSLYIDNIHLQAAATPVMEVTYDDKNKRMHTASYGSNVISHTYYVRDASGTPMGIYTKTVAPNDNNSKAYLTEQSIYGSGRIGTRKLTPSNQVREGDYLYQISDHLGNVRAVVAKDQLSGQVVAVSRTDYYPFGMPMPSRNLEGGYRYGYQGEFAEKDPETGFNSFELRLWDARIGRWMSPDPYGQYPSAYLGMGNNPINGVDPDGGIFILGKLTGDQIIAWKSQVAKIRSTAYGRYVYDILEKDPNFKIHVVFNDSEETGSGDFYGGRITEDSKTLPSGSNVLSFSNRISQTLKTGFERERKTSNSNQWFHPIWVLTGHEIYHLYLLKKFNITRGGSELSESRATRFQNYLYRESKGGIVPNSELRNNYGYDTTNEKNSQYRIKDYQYAPRDYLYTHFDREVRIQKSGLDNFPNLMHYRIVRREIPRPCNCNN
jgi:RHS repeat-associated protein